MRMRSALLLLLVTSVVTGVVDFSSSPDSTPPPKHPLHVWTVVVGVGLTIAFIVIVAIATGKTSGSAYDKHFIRQDGKWVCRVCHPQGKINSEMQTAKGGVYTITASGSTSRLKDHLDQHHGGWSSSEKVQTTLQSTWKSGQSRAPLSLQKLLWLLADANLAPDFLNRTSFRINFGPHLKALNVGPLSRRSLARSVIELGSALRKEVLEALSGKACVVLLDAGTLHRTTLINVCVGAVDRSTRKVFFLESRAVVDTTAETIAALLRSIQRELKEAGANLLAFCSDNASAMIKGCAMAIEELNDGEEQEEEEEEHEEVIDADAEPLTESQLLNPTEL
jgi:hypothetical protein